MEYTHEDGTPFTKEEFLQKLKTDKEFNDEFGNKGIDQISELIEQLKENPDSRRLLVSAWSVHDLPNMTLPPCHYGFQLYTSELSDERRYNIWFNNNYETGMERYFDPNNLPDFDNEYYVPTPKRSISLMWNQRSCDLFLGIPFNIASYGLLLEIIAKEVNMVPDELIGNLGDVHLYKNHIDQAKEQMTREPNTLPKLNIVNNLDLVNIKDGKQDRFEKSEMWIENYQPHPTIKAPLSN